MNSVQGKTSQIMRNFEYEDLAPHARIVAREFHDLAVLLVNDLNGCAVTLQKLLEARNSALQCVEHKDIPAQ